MRSDMDRPPRPVRSDNVLDVGAHFQWKRRERHALARYRIVETKLRTFETWFRSYAAEIKKSPHTKAVAYYENALETILKEIEDLKLTPEEVAFHKWDQRRREAAAMLEEDHEQQSA